MKNVNKKFDGTTVRVTCTVAYPHVFAPVKKNDSDKAKYIETEYQPIMQYQNKYTLLEVHLITGRSHQIRAHLASIGHPILGDGKYGNHALNQELAKRFSIKGQLLHAYRLEFPDGFIVTAPLPEEFSYF